jgi:uncharacterized protein (TIGR03437 family)
MKLSLVAGMVCAVAALGQVQPSGLQCVANAVAPPIVRVEGITELVGDILLQCSGGAPTPPGVPVPAANIKLYLNTNLTSQLLNNTGLSDAALLIDEPTPAVQKYCPLPCTLLGTGGGLLTNSPYAAGNIFLANFGTGGNTLPPSPGSTAKPIASNFVEWDGVPIDPPGTNGRRLIRITNVRANATQLGLSSTVVAAQIVGLVQINGATPISLNNPLVTLATVQPGFSFRVNATTGQNCPGNSALGNFTITFKENFRTAFKTRVTGQTLSNPGGSQPQNIPGFAYNTESAFVPDIPAGAPPGTGKAAGPTTFHMFIENVPAGIQLSVPTQTTITDSTGVSTGTLVTVGGTVLGSNSVYVPNSQGSLDIFFLVGARSNSLNPVTANVNIYPVGVPTSLPAHVKGTVGFPFSMFEQNTLFTTDSPNAFSIPRFADRTQTGILTPPWNPYTTFTTLTDCDPQTQGLMGSGDPPVMFQSFSGPLIPANFNYSVVSPGQVVSNVIVSQDPSATWLNVSLSQSSTPVTATMSVTPSTITQTLTTNLVFSSRNLPGAGNYTVPVTYKVTPGPWFTRYGMQSAASYIPDVIAPGELFLLAGNEFGPSQLASLVLDSNGRATTVLGDTQVLFDNQPAALNYSFSANGIGYVAGFAPFALDGKTTTNVQVVYNGLTSPPVAIPVVDAVPALFTADASGGGQGAILNGDLSYNSASNPEAVGNQVVLFGTGAGQTTPGGRDGAVAGVGGAVGTFKLPIKVFIDGIVATDIAYSGPAPSEIEGVFQINLRIPPGVRSGNMRVVVQVGDKLSQPGVTVAVK